MKDEFVVKGAMATCQFGVAPCMLNTILDNMNVYFNGKLAVTSMTMGPCFPSPGFGTCNVVPNMPKPCVCMITKWDSPFNDLYINRIAHPLTKNSKGSCALSPVPMCISFTTTGQIPIPAVPAIAAPDTAVPHMSDMNPLATNEEEKEDEVTPIIKSIEFWDSTGCVVDDVPKNGIVTIVAETDGHDVGDKLTFEVPGVGSFVGTVEADGRAYVRNCDLSLLNEIEGGEEI